MPTAHILRVRNESEPQNESPVTHRPAVFGSIEQVARIERLRVLGPDPEPEDVQLLRHEAAEEARKIVAEAFATAAGLREEARQAGYEAGWAEGHAAGVDAATEAIREETEGFRAQYRAEMEAMLEHIERAGRAQWLDAESQIVSLSLEIARKVVKQETAINREIVADVVKNALRRVVDNNGLRIRVNAADLETIRAARSDILMILDGARSAEVEVVEDRRVGPGGCVVESASGTIDATIETQFRTIEENLHATDLKARRFDPSPSSARPAELPNEE